jgi:Pyridine nucleotide-disulphide oxidoreductase
MQLHCEQLVPTWLFLYVVVILSLRMLVSSPSFLGGLGLIFCSHSALLVAQFSADNVLITTGGHAVTPEIPGASLGITSDGFFDLKEQPRRVAVVGAGYIAVELAGVLRELGEFCVYLPVCVLTTF